MQITKYATVVRNHREHSLTVGMTRARNLTAGFRDGRGLYVHVIRWEPGNARRFIYLRKGLSA
ncbi:hypothetical protein KCP75_09570 [Salmonella enterica subsp. enterica]|nr:hypothetical protein KCP75_09570 [Salmonella enterica subsp. enterica]